jgi:hypothetical protein
MSGGQHRDDEGNGPSQPGEAKRKEAKIARANRPNAAAQAHGCAQENKKLRQTFLTEPTSLEMFSTVIWRVRLAQILSGLLPSGPSLGHDP